MTIDVRKSQRGFSMIEVLVAFAVLSVGMLGIAGLLMSGQRSGQASFDRTQAVALASDMLERILANPGGAAAYETGMGSNALGRGNAVSQPAACVATECTAAETVARDRWEWDRKLDGASTTDGVNAIGGLIQASGCIVFEPNPDMANSGRMSVIVSWLGLSETSDALVVGAAECGDIDDDDARFRRQVVLDTIVVDPEDLVP